MTERFINFMKLLIISVFCSAVIWGTLVAADCEDWTTWGWAIGVTLHTDREVKDLTNNK